ncbi:MAG: lytic transglycosylase domain-containing protein [Reyranella sp.]|uniref:lytic transglycosylase domain-containing protein n=1 Tax=Reyranella sp. TaxID=1929291 RepID=UPI00120BC843|nr:lytic transglycosylase domain-containing protein [Reyranella sp.]TAJ89037.1 MAG: lytic transglycosylase domain-containing protein [Reyranella sp.]TBR30074.1 MAG: lytic transglycosylase domain-containing protein [Reyranella sp.]
MKHKKSPFILLAALLAAAPALAQIAAPTTGVRRLPGDVEKPSPPAPSEASPAPAVQGRGAPAAAPQPVAADPLSAAEIAAFTAALKAIDDGRWADARAAVANFRNTLLDRYVAWSILRLAPRTEANFTATWRFLREQPDWPEPEVLRRQAEERIGPETPATDVVRYFTAFPPLTSTGHMRRLEAASTAAPNDVARFARDTWQNATLRNSDENDFLNRYAQLLTGPDQIARFDRILREGRHQVARDLVPKLPPDYQPIANARLAMATRAADAGTLLKAVAPARLAEAPLRLERVQWIRRTGTLDEAKAALSGSIPNQTDAWWTERNLVVRGLLDANRPADAYAVAIGHGLTKGVSFAEAEFLAGWIALRQLKKPAVALKHFSTLYDGVSTDISKSRGAYWLARTYEAARQTKDASDWYGRAAGYGQTFYGQLAAKKLQGVNPKLPVDPVPTPAEKQALAGRELATMARYLGQVEEYDRARPFLLRLARSITTPGEVALLAQLSLDLKRPDVGLTVARRGAENGVVLFDAAFPIVDLGATGPIERALALALTKQESSFNAGAVSTSGALGLMQLLPGTARDVAGRLSVPFIQDKLTRDPAYNVQLGSQYLAEMLQRFGGSYELALAAYNAGPNRVARWIEAGGDPRTARIDMVDWIEMIPFRETRNYVQRIMEGVTVYRSRLNGPHQTVPPAVGRS